MTRVKICGIQQPADALAALRAGADLIGLVFVPERRRRVDITRAREVVAALRTEAGTSPPAVGLFADQTVEEVNETVRHCGLHMVQLCGREPLDYCGRIETSVIKVIHVREGVEPEAAVESLAQEVSALHTHGHQVTLDRRVEGLQGGTGETFEWEIAGRLSALGFSFLLAGGLSPDNVTQAVRIASPWGVDVSSGVETDGRKDPAKIHSFIDRVREVDAQLKTPARGLSRDDAG